jgi:hypothetical protein
MRFARLLWRGHVEPHPCEQVAHCLQPFELLAAALAPRDMRFDQRRVGGVELAVDEAAEQQFLVNAQALLHAP